MRIERVRDDLEYLFNNQNAEDAVKVVQRLARDVGAELPRLRFQLIHEFRANLAQYHNFPNGSYYIRNEFIRGVLSGIANMCSAHEYEICDMADKQRLKTLSRAACSEWERALDLFHYMRADEKEQFNQHCHSCSRCASAFDTFRKVKDISVVLSHESGT